MAYKVIKPVLNVIAFGLSLWFKELLLLIDCIKSWPSKHINIIWIYNLGNGVIYLKKKL